MYQTIVGFIYHFQELELFTSALRSAQFPVLSAPGLPSENDGTAMQENISVAVETTGASRQRMKRGTGYIGYMGGTSGCIPPTGLLKVVLILRWSYI